MNAPETIRAAEPINPAHQVLVKADEALCVEEVARAILGGDKPTKACIKDAAKQLKKLADMGLIEMEPRAGGVPFYRLIAAPSSVVTNNPHTGTPRNPLDIESDPKGLLIVKDGEPLKAASKAERVLTPEAEAEREDFEANREEFTLLGLIADIRSAAGDPDGRLMQDELVQHIAGVVKERDLLKAENLALKTLEGSMPGFGAEFEASRKHREEMSRVIAELQALRTSHTNAINEADRLRAELAAERQAREALQEQANAVDVKDAAVGYLIRAPKRDPILRRELDSARLAALGAVRAGAARAEVLAVVPVGVARRGAEWGDA